MWEVRTGTDAHRIGHPLPGSPHHLPTSSSPHQSFNLTLAENNDMEEIIKALGWPHLAFLFGVFFVLLFKRPLFGLISRVTSIDKSGIKASQTPEAQREEQKKETVQQLLLAIGDSIVLQDIEARIKADFKAKGLETEGDTIKVLMKHLAATRVLLEFEQIHNLVFGSQIFLLKKLNEVAGQGKPAEFILTHFQHVQGLFPE
jgi:hypothetical protein